MPRGESGSDETTDEDEGESELERNRRPRDGKEGESLGLQRESSRPTVRALLSGRELLLACPVLAC